MCSSKKFVGTWDYQGLREVSLRDAKQNGVSGKNYGAQTAQGSEIGTAKVRGIQYELWSNRYSRRSVFVFTSLTFK
jgi:hypothetical protein